MLITISCSLTMAPWK